MSTEFIFVYGTLCGSTASRMRETLMPHCDYVSNGYMQGKLYDVGQYPGAVESQYSADRVYGELYKIVDCDSVLTGLDEYEECTDHFPEPHEYIRQQLPIILAGGDSVIAWIYIFNHDISRLKHIKTGDYLAYIQG
ncbi:MAG: gamma-glutamylcyclotransferase [Gammaproteobacteria bacterium]|nr:gamma-glutamylcyclotransferase [Gammaproteobacteria bacterium]